MTLFKTLLLGIIQGITEFLPISSSGHLVLSQNVFGITEPGVTLEVMLHFGTLMSILVWFRQDLFYLFKSGLAIIGIGAERDKTYYTYQNIDYRALVVRLMIGTLPAVIVALLFRDTFERLYNSTLAVGIALIFTGLIIWATTKTYRQRIDMGRITLLDSILIGIAQSIAIVPGLSRSGMTITSGLVLGIQRDLAVRFSFLLAIPVILGATILELRSLLALTSGSLITLLVGTVAAFVSGLFAISLLLRIVRQGKMEYFSYYCWVVGSIVIISGIV